MLIPQTIICLALVVLGTVNAQTTVINYRLPNNTVPVHYEVALTTRVDQADFAFEGSVDITLDCVQASNSITIHSRQLTILEVTVRLEGSVGFLPGVDYTEETDTEFLIVSVPGGLLQNTRYVLFVNFSGELREDQAGFYRSSYVNSDGDRVWLATTQFETTDARHGFPCYDEPAARATFDISITHSDTYLAESNMPVVSRTPSSEDSTITTVFQTTPVMPTYLLAYVVSDFPHISKTSAGGIQQRLFAAENKIHDGQYGLDFGCLVLDAFGEYLNVKYDLPKMDQFAIPDFSAGAMENWGLVTYRETGLLFSETYSAYNTKTSISTLISHEYAHQWFGNLVTPKWWTYIWLNEGFASLYGTYGVHLVHPEWNVMDLYAVGTCQNVMNADSGVLRPMTHYIESPIDVSRVFDNVAYAKSGCVLRMWQNAFTDATFTKGLKYYLDKMQYLAAVEEDLFAGLSQAITEDKTGALNDTVNLNTVFYSWTRQNGYPCITVTRNYATGVVTLTQERFINNGDANTLWWVPYAYATASNAEFETAAVDWIPATKTHDISQLIASGDWFILNNKQTGYYRVNYDEQNWKLIINALLDDHTQISTLNRAQLINDAFTFARLNLTDYSIPMQLITYLKAETEYAPWQAFHNNIGTFNRLMAGFTGHAAYKTFMYSLVDKIYTTLTIKGSANELYLNAYARNEAINFACAMGHLKCLDETNERVVDEVTNGNLIEPDLQSAIFCNGLRTEEQFVYVWNKILKTTNAAERSRLLPILSCIKSPEHILNVLQASLGNTNDFTVLTTSDRLSMFQAVYVRGNDHVKIVLEFLGDEEFRQSFISRFGTNTYSSTLSSIANYIVTEELQTLFNEVLEASTTVSDAVKLSIATTVESNFEWIETQGTAFTEFIASLVDPEPDSASSISLSIVAFTSIVLLTFRSIF